MSQNLSSVAVVISALRRLEMTNVKMQNIITRNRWEVVCSDI